MYTVYDDDADKPVNVLLAVPLLAPPETADAMFAKLDGSDELMLYWNVTVHEFG